MGNCLSQGCHTITGIPHHPFSHHCTIHFFLLIDLSILFSFLFLETDINEHDHEDTPKEYIAPLSFHSYRLDNLNPSRQVRFKNQPKTSN